MGWNFEQGVLGYLIPPAMCNRYKNILIAKSSPDFALLPELEELLLLLPNHLQGVDEGAAPVQRVSGHQDKGGFGAPECSRD